MKKILTLLLVLSSLPSLCATFTYEARVAGIVAGTLKVMVERGNQRYQVAGKARSEGLWEVIDNWRADFSATGEFVDNNPTLERYYLYERTNSKKREITVTEDSLEVIKNGKKRGKVDPLPGLDVLTALFIVANCPTEQVLHTGRHGYNLVKQSGDETSCSFKVTDDDEESFVAAIEYGKYYELVVPKSIQVRGQVEGVLKLVKVVE